MRERFPNNVWRRIWMHVHKMLGDKIEDIVFVPMFIRTDRSVTNRILHRVSREIMK